jgi:DNA-nicking Smr family endonuclease
MSDDKTIWESYKRVVVPAAKKRRAPVAHANADKAAVKAVLRRAAEKAPMVLPKDNVASVLKTDKSLERKREKALRQGAIEIEARLDLHGMTQSEAFNALAVFMHEKTASGKRHLLVITGKGSREGSGTGVLRANLRNWLGQLPEAKAVLALRSASLKHGGEGAFYIIMRRK